MSNSLVIREQTASQSINELVGLASGNRDALYQKVAAYYTKLRDAHPGNIEWNGIEFEYTSWDDISLVLAYDTHTRYLSFTDVLYPREQRPLLYELIDLISPSNPSDLILPIPYLDVLVPFLDVERIGYLSFASGEGM